MPNQITPPQFDKHRKRWAIRWIDDDGRKRKKATFKTREEAFAFAEEMRKGKPPPPLSPRLRGRPPKKPKVVSIRGGKHEPQAVTVTHLILNYDGSAKWWDQAHGALACELLTAQQSKDSVKVDLLNRTITGFSKLANSQPAHRDVKKLENWLRKLQKRDDDMRKAAKNRAVVA